MLCLISYSYLILNLQSSQITLIAQWAKVSRHQRDLELGPLPTSLSLLSHCQKSITFHHTLEHKVAIHLMILQQTLIEIPSSTLYFYLQKTKKESQKELQCYLFHFWMIPSNHITTVYIFQTTLTLIFIYLFIFFLKTNWTHRLLFSSVLILIYFFTATLAHFSVDLDSRDRTRTCDLERQLTWSPETSRSYRILGCSEELLHCA